MSTITAPAQQAKLPVKFAVTDVAIAILKEDYLPLTISGVGDKAGLDAVHKARMLVRSKRVDVERTRKELKAGALAYGRIVDAEAKRITSLLEPIESHLTGEEQRITDEKARIKRKAEEARQAALEARLQKLLDVGCLLSPFAVEKMTDDQFVERLDVATRLHEGALAAEREAEAERTRHRLAEDECRRVEEERLGVEREKLEAERLEVLDQQRPQREEHARLDGARAKLEAEEKERLRQIEIEQETKAAAELARLEERQRIDREAREETERKEAEGKETARLEALRPDKEKLLEVAVAVEFIVVPDLSSAETVDQIEEILVNAAMDIRVAIDQM